MRCEVVSSVQQVVLYWQKESVACLTLTILDIKIADRTSMREMTFNRFKLSSLVSSSSIFGVLYFIQVVFHSIYEIDTLKTEFYTKNNERLLL